MTSNNGKFVAYLRVSTERQGRSGLGLEAQREAVQRFVRERGGRIIAPEFVEVESGKRNDRPQLAMALKRCRLTGAILLVAKLDRLSRNAAFLLTLKDSGAEFIAADMPDANETTVGIMSIIAQTERKAISERTKAALAAAKRSGTKLGGRRPGSVDIAEHWAKGVAAKKAKADRIASELRDTIDQMIASHLSLNAMAARLNEDGVLTSRGKTGAWTATAVRRMILRLSA
jgi:DNA invertase Pin-like site-specific DNA recombinase